MRVLVAPLVSGRLANRVGRKQRVDGETRVAAVEREVHLRLLTLVAPPVALTWALVVAQEAADALGSEQRGLASEADLHLGLTEQGLGLVNV